MDQIALTSALKLPQSSSTSDVCRPKALRQPGSPSGSSGSYTSGSSYTTSDSETRALQPRDPPTIKGKNQQSLPSSRAVDTCVVKEKQMRPMCEVKTGGKCAGQAVALYEVMILE